MSDVFVGKAQKLEPNSRWMHGAISNAGDHLRDFYNAHQQADGASCTLCTSAMLQHADDAGNMATQVQRKRQQLQVAGIDEHVRGSLLLMAGPPGICRPLILHQAMTLQAKVPRWVPAWSPSVP